MRKVKLYLETSIFNVATSDQVPEYRDLTLKLLEDVKAGIYEGYTSGIVILEIDKASEKRASQLMAKINELELNMLKDDDEEIDRLAEKYIQAGLIPETYFDDARHIALASYYELDVVLSWNFEHMVKLKTREGVPAINVLFKYKPIQIASPLELEVDN